MRYSFIAGIGSGAAALGLYSRRHIRRRERLAAAALEVLLNAIDANDHTTGAHARRVATYSLILGRAAELDERTCRSLERVALFHDVGKIHGALFDVLHDSAPLSARQRQLVATHPQRGADVLSPLSTFYPDLSEGVLSHHERWDGRGYPRRLRGEQIPLQARVVSIADAFDVITHSRPYKRGQSVEEAAEKIRAGCGKQFDPTLTDLFLTPHVFADVRRAAAAIYRTHGRKEERRQPRREGAPDITFRWRPAAPEPRVQDREIPIQPG